MASSARQDMTIRTCSTGRNFACMDPERQGVPGDSLLAVKVRPPAREERPPRTDWMRVQPDRDTSMFEGSSSRRGR